LVAFSAAVDARVGIDLLIKGAQFDEIVTAITMTEAFGVAVTVGFESGAVFAQGNLSVRGRVIAALGGIKPMEDGILPTHFGGAKLGVVIAAIAQHNACRIATAEVVSGVINVKPTAIVFACIEARSGGHARTVNLNGFRARNTTVGSFLDHEHRVHTSLYEIATALAVVAFNGGVNTVLHMLNSEADGVGFERSVASCINTGARGHNHSEVVVVGGNNFEVVSGLILGTHHGGDFQGSTGPVLQILQSDEGHRAGEGGNETNVVVGSGICTSAGIGFFEIHRNITSENFNASFSRLFVGQGSVERRGIVTGVAGKRDGDVGLENQAHFSFRQIVNGDVENLIGVTLRRRNGNGVSILGALLDLELEILFGEFVAGSDLISLTNGEGVDAITEGQTEGGDAFIKGGLLRGDESRGAQSGVRDYDGSTTAGRSFVFTASRLPISTGMGI
jgi:hypothetical protein